MHVKFRFFSFIIFLLSAGFSIIGCKTKDAEPDSAKTYYWAEDKKIEVAIHPSIVTLRDSADLTKNEIANLLNIQTEKIQAITKIHNHLWKIDLNERSLKLSNKAIPTLVLSGTPIFMTGEISIMPNPNSDIEMILKKYNLKLSKKTTYGAYLVISPDPSQTLSIANTIHEKENVKWVAPDIIANYRNMI